VAKIKKKKIMMNDRRKYKRYQVNQNAFVFGSDHPGRISNISLAGMKFSHICEEELCDTENISILDPENEFFMKQIPCQVVSQSITGSDLPASSIHTAHVRVSFQLSPSQETRLKEYINTASVGSA